MAPSSPTVAAWELGRRLREKRDEAGLSATAAARKFGITAAYLSEFENGKKNIGEERLARLIEAYELDEQEAAELFGLRNEAGNRGWWSEYSALFSDELLRFFGYEHGAESVRSYDSAIVNGLLQTENYARAVIEAGAPNIRLAEVERRLECRLRRQHRVTGSEPLHLSSVMSEAVLHQRIGGAGVLAEQLEHLVELINAHPDTLDIRVVPFESTGHDAIGGSPFLLMTFPTGKLPTLLWHETVTSTQLITDSLTIREHSLAHTEASKAALDRKDSLDKIASASRNLRG
ncbi:helix-turn-helix domain-containing protein [Actinopolyspora mortivallis]|uniref:helix-turn-helix domain-containing protein n=1 Tax=Actinopolyspora mortivallis TaxID=33906 RepID=UPI000375307D|nr:helix-turn-helix transcriptional regulator [Actinopolyspora mortivallis]